MGVVDANYVLISSVAHDHGHIAASPDAWTHHEVGVKNIGENIVVTGIMSKEARGTSNIIYNIRTSNISISCFADLGDEQRMKTLTEGEKKVLSTTDVAFVRPNPLSEGSDISSGELALQSCNPKIVIPYHFYPTKFLERVPELKKMSPYLERTENMIGRLGYEKHIVDNHNLGIDMSEYKKKPTTAILFSDIHPQVIYR